jgi:hypothetical protein
MNAIQMTVRLGLSILLLGVGMETGTAVFLWLAGINFLLFVGWGMKLMSEEEGAK